MERIGAKLTPRRSFDDPPVAKPFVREILPQDVPAVGLLLKQSPEAAQWPPEVFLREPGDGTSILVAERAGEVIGVIAARAAAGEAEILNLAVLPPHRRRGLGRSLLEGAIARVRAGGATSVFLEVREGNPAARAFYATMGFIATGRRRGYYRDPAEDAIVLSRLL